MVLIPFDEPIDTSRACRFGPAIDASIGKGWQRGNELRLLQTAPFDIPAIRLKPTRDKQHDEDDQDNADDPDGAVTVAVAVTAEAATEATQQKDDEEDEEYE